MHTTLLTLPADLKRYDAWVRSHPQGSLWQSPEWKHYQKALGRETRIYALQEAENIVASALVVIDRTTGGFSTWDVPRGPLVALSFELRAASLIETIAQDARKERCLSLFFSPSTALPLKAQSSKLKASTRHIQSAVTRILDLTLPEDALLKQMHQKGRYNIKVAEKHGVRVEHKTVQDIDAFYDLLRSTGKRDDFTILPKSHYARFLTNLDGSFLLLAFHEKKPVAGLLGVLWNGIGYYYYGASDHARRNLMAPYLLQWEAMKYCKERGCSSYDLLGIAPPDAGPDHPWQGISGFKEKFGGTVVEYPHEQEIVLRPIASALLAVKRKIFG